MATTSSFQPPDYVDQLAAVASQVANERGYSLSSDFELALRGTVAIHASAARPDWIAETDAHLSGIANTRKVMESVIAIARSRNVTGELTQELLFDALKSLCPLWPFCR